MKISYDWLRQYIDLNERPEEVAELLTSVGLEVEGIEEYESVRGGLKGLVVGEVVECAQHPNADRLSCTKVNIGTGDLLSIVCGAPNVAAGQKVIVATVGTMLFPSDGEPFEIKAAKIRGEHSQGMLCAEDEIGLGAGHDGIMVLPESTPVGTAVSELFDVVTDVVFEIGLTPNRADAASHLGVARDLRAVIAQRKGEKRALKRPSAPAFKPNNERSIRVEVRDADACPRYVGVTITGIRVAPSPSWLQHRLRAIGVRPINNIVDVTNYVNHALGQPLHAFDADRIQGDTVVVRTEPEGTAFLSLDGVERSLDERDLMICDAEKGMCIAGVFGGAGSGVTNETTSVFLESAYFNPVWVRKTAKRHALHTDASFRFERGIDPNGTRIAAEYAASLIVEVAGGQISSEFSDTHPELFEPFKLSYRVDRMNAFIGAEIPIDHIERICWGLDIVVAAKNGQTLELEVPRFKVDVQREADVVEEVLRIYGYDQVPYTGRMLSTVSDMKPTVYARSREAVAAMLTGNGYLECMSNSMIDERFAALSNAWTAGEVVRLNNALSSEMGIMRPALVFSALQNAAYNINRQQTNLKLFEFGNIYRNAEKAFYEEERLGIVVAGWQISEQWRIADVPGDWFALKGALEQILVRLGIAEGRLKAVPTAADWFEYGMDWQLPGRESQVVAKGGLIRQELRRAVDIKRDVFYLEIHWRALVDLRREAIQIGELPRFPEVRRDLALLLDKQVAYAEVERLAFQSERNLLKSVRLFDVYEGKGLPSGKKSYAVSFALRDDQKTLTDAEVESVMERLLSAFRTSLGAELR